MKKLLVLALVLSMATMANAALTLNFSATQAVGDVTFAIEGDGSEATGTFYLGVVLEGGAALNIGSAIVDYTGNAAGISFEPVESGVAAMLGLADAMANVQLTGNPPVGQVNPPLTGVLVHNIILTISGPATVKLYNADGAELATQDVSTPEPVTLALLGLGALALRRRK